MDQTPTRAPRTRAANVHVLDQENIISEENNGRGIRIRKPPPITPRRFNKFFTPRPRDAAQAVKTSRKALRTISSAALNSRQKLAQIEEEQQCDYLPANENNNSRKKRKFSLVSSAQSTPPSTSFHFLPSSQEPLASSPIKYGRDDLNEEAIEDDEDAMTEIDEDAWSEDGCHIPTGPRIIPYGRTGTSRSLLSHRLTGRRRIQIAENSNLWQSEAASFYSSPDDVNRDFQNRLPNILPFSMTACYTNPIVAAGDEEGIVRFLDTANANQGEQGFGKTVLEMRPHDNALMDLAFSYDDNYLATASGDQTCVIIDVHSQKSLYSLRAHNASVKRIQFQPGSGNNILASCGRDGAICLWDLRTKGQALSTGRRARLHVTEMSEDVSCLSPVLSIYNAHSTGQKFRNTTTKGRQNNIPGRNDFSITSLTFLDQSRNNLLATASEVDTVIKLWDMRLTQTSARKQGHTHIPVSTTEEPRSHAIHRRFGINSIALNTDGSRIFALARDHTVYAYSTSHLILGCDPEMTQSTTQLRKSLAPKRTESGTGIGPIYGLRHPSLRVATFWPRLAVRYCSRTNAELLAVGSTDDCAIVFPTSERYHTASARRIPTLHDPKQLADASVGRTTINSHDATPASRPQAHRSATSSFTSLFTKDRQEEDSLPIYYHGTPLIRGHRKEVTSLAWSTEGNLVTTSDDFTVRCWREDQHKARKLRETKHGAVELQGMGWASVGVESWDDEY
ncbi:hypothetical protein H2198_010552 [Neophaeococcomyces mojaviensis]|uniref:Uncharacterized protein n=1 Tax=Neophaeococcomyces mojaviensis TaxID=3383035 RepID=A0ACC2ZRE7_9EURO|nr:hypothetical protein H2198_010552 [Knufia sp. JES_112]